MNESPGDTPAAPGPPVAAGVTKPKPSPAVRRAIPVDRPHYRRLNVYAFDPSLSIELENVALNRETLRVPWEHDPATGVNTLQPGPVGEYLEVVDVDPASNCFYEPVNLNDPYLLAQDGLIPSEANPQFHQQMVYAVAMTTIENFERALGRHALWSPHWNKDVPDEESKEEYIARLRIYPHAMREANAYYSPEKKALLFGYFPAPTDDVRFHLPGGMVFCCLSHDVVAHETTHALLDGMHRRFIEASNVDVLAFHEAFADISALFQHFSLPEVLCQQIAKTRGDLGTDNLLAQLAQEFGNATGLHGALRNALGKYDEATNRWQRSKPDPLALQVISEPHERGSILVAAIFEAFLMIYKTRSADLMRIATNGTGILPDGAPHPDLVNRLAGEAAKSAQHVLNMCIRALDYVPPADITFGDYLRALITADYDLVPDDDLGYRVAIIEAFRQYGIFPRDVRSLSVDSLRWQTPLRQDFQPQVLPVLRDLRWLAERQGYTNVREQIYWQQKKACADVNRILVTMAGQTRAALGADETDSRFADFGLDVTRILRPDGAPNLEVHSARPARRVGPSGNISSHAIIQVTQRRPGYLDLSRQTAVDRQINAKVPGAVEAARTPDFWIRGGATLVINLDNGTVQYSVIKNIWSDGRVAWQRAFLSGRTDDSLRAMYFGGVQEAIKEPFAFLHRLG